MTRPALALAFVSFSLCLSACDEVHPSQWEHSHILKSPTVDPIGAVADFGPEWEVTAAAHPVGLAGEVAYFLKRPVGTEAELTLHPESWDRAYDLSCVTCNPGYTLQQRGLDGWELVGAAQPVGNSGDIGFLYKRPTEEFSALHPETWEYEFEQECTNCTPATTIALKAEDGWELAAAVHPFGNSGGHGLFFKRPIDNAEVHPSEFETKMELACPTCNPNGVIDPNEAEGWELAATGYPIGNSQSVGYFFKRAITFPE